MGSDSIMINLLIGIEELSKNNNNISVYPNPATDFITIDWNSNVNIKELSIYNISGKLVLRKRIETKANNIRAIKSELSKGNYIIIHVISI